MRMYVANASAQFHTFAYRIPEVPQMRQLTIQPMRQIVLPDDMSKPQLDAVIEQHSRYGFASVEDVKSGTVKKRYTKLVYSIGSPVSGPIIDMLFHSNHGVLDAQGREIRKETAIVANQAIQKQLEAERENGLEADIKDIEITLQEEEQPGGGYDRPTAQAIAEGYRVVNEVDAVPAKTTRRRRK